MAETETLTPAERTPRKSDHNRKPLLVVQTAFLGDLLLSIPLLLKLRQIEPGRQISLVTREGLSRLFLDLGLVDQVFEIKKGQWSSYVEIQKQLRSTLFEWIICPHESFTSARFCWGIPAVLKISYWQVWNFIFFKHRVQKNKKLPEALRQLSLVKDLNSTAFDQFKSLKNENLNRPDEHGRLPQVPDWAEMSLRDRLLPRTSPFPSSKKTICLFPGSVWATKQWTEEGFVQVAEKYHKEGFQIYWLGSKEEMQLGKKLEARVKGSRSLVGQLSLLQTLVLLSHSGAAVTNDSAGQHLAAVAGIPCVSIFGPTVPTQGFRPWNDQAVVAQLEDVKCRPCGAHGHQRCPKGTHECMVRLPAGLVARRLAQVLEKNKNL